MVSLEGKIPPFRITRAELFGLANQIQQRLISLSTPVESISITLGDFSEDCNNISELETFLKDYALPKVVKEARLTIRAEISIDINMTEDYAHFYVNNASDTSEARSFADIILTFFKNHGAPRLFNKLNEAFLEGLLIPLSLILVIAVIASFFNGTVFPYRGFFVFGAICLATFWAYIRWSDSTPDTPSMSFFHSIIWIEQPKTNVQWAFISTILVGVLISYLSGLLI